MENFKEAVEKLIEAGRATNEAYHSIRETHNLEEVEGLWELVKEAEAIGSRILEKILNLEE